MADRDDRKDDPADETAGGILGISRVPVGGTGEIRSHRGSAGTKDDDQVTPLEDEEIENDR